MIELSLDAERLGWIFSLILKSTALMLFSCLIITRLKSFSAASRHLLLRCVSGILLGLPALGLLLPAWTPFEAPLTLRPFTASFGASPEFPSPGALSRVPELVRPTARNYTLKTVPSVESSPSLVGVPDAMFEGDWTGGWAWPAIHLETTLVLAGELALRLDDSDDSNAGRNLAITIDSSSCHKSSDSSVEAVFPDPVPRPADCGTRSLAELGSQSADDLGLEVALFDSAQPCNQLGCSPAALGLPTRAGPPQTPRSVGPLGRKAGHGALLVSSSRLVAGEGSPSAVRAGLRRPGGRLWPEAFILCPAFTSSCAGFSFQRSHSWSNTDYGPNLRNRTTYPGNLGLQDREA